MYKDLESLHLRQQKWIDCINTGDIDAYASLLNENGVWIPPNQDPVIGREAFKEWLAPFFSQFSYDFSITGERIKIAGDWAIEKAKFTSKMTPENGDKPMKHSGTFIVIWHRGNDDTWYIEHYIDDTDL